MTADLPQHTPAWCGRCQERHSPADGHRLAPHEERCVVCGSTDDLGHGESILHEIRWAVCSEHVAEGYEHAVAEHQPCDC